MASQPYTAGRGFTGQTLQDHTAALNRYSTLAEQEAIDRKSPAAPSWGFKNFYMGRPELMAAGNPYQHDWLGLNRPDIQRHRLTYDIPSWRKPNGQANEPPAAGEGTPDGRYGYGSPGTQFQPLGLGQGQSSHNLYNVNTREGGEPGTGMMAGNASPSQSYAGGGWDTRPSGWLGSGSTAIGSQPAVTSGARALPPGSQFPGAIDTTST